MNTAEFLKSKKKCIVQKPIHPKENLMELHQAIGEILHEEFSLNASIMDVSQHLREKVPAPLEMIHHLP